MLQSLSKEQRQAFRQTWLGLPEDQREAYRRKLMQMSPQQREAELARP